MTQMSLPRTVPFRTAWILLIALACTNVLLILHSAVDLPYWDEWEVLLPDALPAGLTWDWLFARHNEHLVVTTKFLVWLLYKLNGWNLVSHVALNLLTWLAMVAWVIRLGIKQPGNMDSGIPAAFSVFIFSTIFHENLYWAFQSAFHLCLFFFFIAVELLFDEKQSSRRILTGAAFAALSIFSMSFGPGSCAVLLLSWLFFKLVRFRAGRENSTRFLCQAAAVTIVIGGSLAGWVISLPETNQSSIIWPDRLSFWNFFTNQISWGFGIGTTSFLLGLLCFLIVILPPAIRFSEIRAGRSLEIAEYKLFTAIFGLLAAAAIFALGRSGGLLSASKFSRYAEVTAFLVPLSAIAWATVLNRLPLLRKRVLVGIWGLCFFAYSDDWQFRTYSNHGRDLKNNESCVRDYYAGKGPAICPALYPTGSIADRLDAARKLNLSFYRRLRSR